MSADIHAEMLPGKREVEEPQPEEIAMQIGNMVLNSFRRQDLDDNKNLGKL
jgi:hypothetical protein